jgi:hypothetical protein
MENLQGNKAQYHHFGKGTALSVAISAKTTAGNPRRYPIRPSFAT